LIISPILPFYAFFAVFAVFGLRLCCLSEVSFVREKPAV